MASLDGFYDERYFTAPNVLPKTDARKAAWEEIVRYLGLNARVPPLGTVVDFGAGHCEFINSLNAPRRFAIDASPVGLRDAAPGVKAIVGDYKSLRKIPPSSVDYFFSSNLFEHMGKDDIYECVKEARRILAPGGEITAICPNFAECPRQYFDEFTHLTPLTDKSMADLFEHFGLEVLRSDGKFLPFTARGMFFNRLLFRIYLNLPYRPLARQFLITARKN